MLSEQLILGRSGNFDIETVFRLSLSGLDLKNSDLSKLNPCKNLETLDLSKTGIPSLMGLKGNMLINLRSLDASGNGIVSVKQMQQLPSVQYLYMQGNDIGNIAELKHLSHAFPSLETLYLQDVDRSNGNSVCRIHNYLEEVQRLFVNLKVLDGEQIKKGKLLKDFETKSLASSSSLEVDLKPENWFADVKTDVKIMTDKDLDRMLGPRMNQVKSGLKDCDKLSREAARLLQEASRAAKVKK